MIDTTKCIYEESHIDEEYGTVHYFIYPKNGMDETEFYTEEDYGNVVGCCLSLTVQENGEYYMQLSPTVEEPKDFFSDVDWRDLFEGENYDEQTVINLLKIVKEKKVQ